MTRTPELQALIEKFVPVTDEVVKNALNDRLASINSQIQGYEDAKAEQITQIERSFAEETAKLLADKAEIEQGLALLDSPTETVNTDEQPV